jgi:hypothetical protein
LLLKLLAARPNRNSARARATVSPDASINSASATADRSSCEVSRAIAVIGPSAAGLTKLVSNRVVTAVRSGGRLAITALPVAESSIAASMPPCTVP